ncbi:MAG: phasin superfamily protein [Syntrophobacteraceae bacterium]|nr:phasin superfamily protein [Syntrophobacteraceae bacterium]
MFELFEKAVLTGIGALSLTQKKGEELLGDLKEKYKFSEEEGRAFIEKVQSAAKETRERIAEAAETEVRKAIDRIGLVPKDEFDQLKQRLEELEKKQG